MKPPISVRPLTDAEHETLMTGQRATDAFVRRRSQVLLASARGELVPRIAQYLGCDPQTVRNAIHAFNAGGLAALQSGSSRPHTVHVAFDRAAAKRLVALLHRSPRDFGHPTSLWTLELAADVSFAEGLTTERVSGETVRATLARLGIRWRRAKRWITSPDPAYPRKKGNATG